MSADECVREFTNGQTDDRQAAQSVPSSFPTQLESNLWDSFISFLPKIQDSSDLSRVFCSLCSAARFLAPCDIHGHASLAAAHPSIWAVSSSP